VVKWLARSIQEAAYNIREYKQYREGASAEVNTLFTIGYLTNK
jgi:hypothetical protein